MPFSVLHAENGIHKNTLCLLPGHTVFLQLIAHELSHRGNRMHREMDSLLGVLCALCGSINLNISGAVGSRSVPTRAPYRETTAQRPDPGCRERDQVARLSNERTGHPTRRGSLSIDRHRPAAA